MILKALTHALSCIICQLLQSRMITYVYHLLPRSNREVDLKKLHVSSMHKTFESSPSAALFLYTNILVLITGRGQKIVLCHLEVFLNNNKFRRTIRIIHWIQDFLSYLAKEKAFCINICSFLF